MSPRLTFLNTRGELIIPGINLENCNSAERAALEKLKAYEDIGYSPEEMENIIREALLVSDLVKDIFGTIYKRAKEESKNEITEETDGTNQT